MHAPLFPARHASSTHTHTVAFSPQAPVDPHVVLGGFTPDASRFTNYSAEATAFVVTLPLSGRAQDLSAVRAWEAALVEMLADPREGGVAKRLLSEGNLTLSFSTERSVRVTWRPEDWYLTSQSTIA